MKTLGQEVCSTKEVCDWSAFLWRAALAQLGGLAAGVIACVSQTLLLVIFGVT